MKNDIVVKMSDELDILIGKEYCPVCASIYQKNTQRCPECGTFHSGIHLEDREAPTPEERVAAREVDPTDYSINPNTAIVDEEFDSDDSSVKNWTGGSTDFSFIDDEPVSKVESKQPNQPLDKDEILHED